MFKVENFGKENVRKEKKYDNNQNKGWSPTLNISTQTNCTHLCGYNQPTDISTNPPIPKPTKSTHKQFPNSDISNEL